MALVATVGASTSNSYVTRLEADAYFQLGMHPNALKWHDQKYEAKDAYLIQATRMIDACPISGAKYDTDMTSGVPDQSLKFPRAQDYDDSTEYIPVDIKTATYEQAIWLVSMGISDTREQLQAQGVTSASIGDVSETYSGAPASSNPVHRLAPGARAILVNGGFLSRGGCLST